MKKTLLQLFILTNIYALSVPQSVCNGVGEIKYINAIYTGECKNNKKEGKGILLFDNGVKYEGEYKDDKRDGHGVNTYADGMLYEGAWSNDQKEGYGVLHYVDGSVYEGQWHQDRKNGQGKQTYASGATYEGNWANNAKEGKGVYIDAQGSRYEGEFADNKRNGYGVLTYVNKRVYEGYWLHDLREGEGKIFYQDGQVFYGHWHKDKKNGPGTLVSQYGLCKGIYKDSQLVEVTNDITLKESYVYLNHLRELAGMIPLKANKVLQKAAKSHSYYVEINHESIKGTNLHLERKDKKGFTGITPSDRAIAQGYFSNNIGEGIANFCTNKESMNSLMTGIYHRLGVLSFEKDEIGIGFTYNKKRIKRNFVHNMGSSKLNKLCQQSGVWFGYYYKKVCADNSLKVSKVFYDEAKAKIRQQNPEYVLWPSANSKNNAYYFKNEIPNPMPGYHKTGNPISIEFNPYYFSKTIEMQSFKLFKNTEEIVNKKILTQKTDPNKKFTRLQYAFFPIDVLEKNTVYNVEFKYSYNGFIDTIKWRFTTMK